MKERCVRREVSGLPHGLCWGVQWSHTCTWQMMLFSPWRMAPNGTCIKTLAGCSLQSLLPPPLSEMAGWLTHACPAMACPHEQQCLYSRNVCALFCVDPVKERDQDVLPNFHDEAVLAIQLIAHTTVNSVRNVL